MILLPTQLYRLYWVQPRAGLVKSSNKGLLGTEIPCE